MGLMKLAVLISNAGTGTNLQAIIDAIEDNSLNATIGVVMSDSAEAYGLKRASKHHFPTSVLQKGDDITALLVEKFPIDYIVLAGWKKIIPDRLIDAFENRIINIHPGLIPDTMEGKVKNPDGTTAEWNRGKFATKAIQNFFDTKNSYAGSTVHFLSKQFDFGPVLARDFEKIATNDTVESLYARLKKREHTILIQSLQKLCK